METKGKKRRGARTRNGKRKKMNVNNEEIKNFCKKEEKEKSKRKKKKAVYL